MRLALPLAAAAALLALALPSYGMAAASCDSIKNPYAGTRYEGVDLRKIRATHVNCKTAKRVVRKSHKKALGMTPPVSGVRKFKWRGWQIRGDIRPPVDHYSARRKGATIRWVF